MSIGQRIAKALNYTNAGQNSRLRSMYLRSLLEYSVRYWNTQRRRKSLMR
jgi:hypothetical protein